VAVIFIDGGNRSIQRKPNKMSYFSAISLRKQVNKDVPFVLDQDAELDFYKNASSLKQQSACSYIAPLGHIIFIPSQYN
jgi:hypothetical protein